MGEKVYSLKRDLFSVILLIYKIKRKFTLFDKYSKNSLYGVSINLKAVNLNIKKRKEL